MTAYIARSIVGLAIVGPAIVGPAIVGPAIVGPERRSDGPVVLVPTGYRSQAALT